MKQGPSTLVVSLPSKWTKKYNVKKGSSLFLKEQGSTISISKHAEKGETKITVDASGTLPMTGYAMCMCAANTATSSCP